jgi:hypothetical protein
MLGESAVRKLRADHTAVVGRAKHGVAQSWIVMALAQLIERLERRFLGRDAVEIDIGGGQVVVTLLRHQFVVLVAKVGTVWNSATIPDNSALDKDISGSSLLAAFARSAICVNVQSRHAHLQFGVAPLLCRYEYYAKCPRCAQRKT